MVGIPFDNRKYALMNLTVSWDNEAHTIIRYMFTEEVSPEDLTAAYALTGAMLDTVDGDTGVAVILDGTLVTGRLRAATVARFETLLADLHPQASKIVLVGLAPSSLLDVLWKHFGGARRAALLRRMIVADSVQQARQIALAQGGQAASA